MFEEKTSEELEKMTAEELNKYWVAKVKHEKEETSKLLSKLNDKVKSLEDSDPSKEIEAQKDLIQEVKTALKEQGKVISALKSSKISGENMGTIDDAVKAALSESYDALKHMKDTNGRERVHFEVKAVGDMTIAGNVTGTMPQAFRFDGVNNIASLRPKIYELIPKLNVSQNTIEWVYETAQEGAAGGTTEGTSKNQLDNNFIVDSLTLKKRTGYYKVSTEMLDDITFMSGWLRNKLATRLLVDVNSQVLSGDGTGNNFTGLIQSATAFAAGVHADQVDNANNIDSLNVALDQIEVANHDLSMPFIVMHSSDITALKYQKVSASDKRYVRDVVEAGNSLMLGNVPIISHNGISAGDFLVGDLAKAVLVQKSNISVEVGLDGSDFTKNLRTILAEFRGQVIVQKNDETAFITGTFATTNAALETP